MRAIKHIFFFIIICFHKEGVCQQEDHNWILNFSSIDSFSVESEWVGSVINFNSLPPHIYKDPLIELDFRKTNAITSDSLGNILFYSNGQAIHGPDHKPIINGDTINYSPKWDWLTLSNEIGEIKPAGFKIGQLMSIIPWPDHNNRWMVLYQNYENVNDSTDFYELWKAEVVLNNENELEVFNKDQVVNSKIFRNGMVTCCQHANGRDWWLLQSNRDTIYSYLINPFGIKLDHLQILDYDIGKTQGQTKFNKNGDRLAYFGLPYQIPEDEIFWAEIFYSKFDRCSGYISEIETTSYQTKLTILNNGIEFSESGKYLYVSERERILQFDTELDNFLESPIVVGEWDGFKCDQLWSVDVQFGLMQRGPDNRIYVSGDQQCFYMHVIEEPEEVGLECNFNQRAIRLESFHHGTVPNFNTLRLGPLDGSPCDTLGLDNNPVSRFWYEQDNTNHQEIQFRDVSYYRPEEWSWTFGDGNTSDEMSPLHTYASNGVYEVCLTVSNENNSNSSCQELQIGPVANQNIQREYDINIFPNPVEDVTRLVFRDYLPEEARIVVYDASGLKVFADRVYQECMIDLSGLGAGIYLYEILDGIEYLSSGKIIKI